MRAFGRYAVGIAAVALLASCGPLPQSSTLSAPAARRSTSGASYRVLYRFDRHPDGDEPISALLNLDGKLYGTTYSGGSTVCREGGSGCGTIYSITPKGAENLVFTFTRTYGANPTSRLIDVNGTLYGTAAGGGWSQKGTVYSLSSTGTVTMLHTFRGRGASKDGQYPSRGHLVNLNGTLYGTTIAGGVTDWGTFYTISTSGREKVLYDFQGGSDGGNPAGLISVKGTLYGTTVRGGGTGCGGYTRSENYGCGTVYSISASGAETILYSFAGGTDGEFPTADLIDVNGTLYGTTSQGGASGHGTVYSITPSGSEKVLYSFAGGADGARPLSALTNRRGTLYGTTSEGGAGTSCGTTGCGTVYSITTSGAESVLYSFAGGDDGSDPESTLLNVRGTLYGTTDFGGVSHGSKSKCCGTVFVLKP